MGSVCLHWTDTVPVTSCDKPRRTAGVALKTNTSVHCTTLCYCKSASSDDVYCVFGYQFILLPYGPSTVMCVMCVVRCYWVPTGHTTWVWVRVRGWVCWRRVKMVGGRCAGPQGRKGGLLPHSWNHRSDERYRQNTLCLVHTVSTLPVCRHGNQLEHP